MTYNLDIILKICETSVRVKNNTKKLRKVWVIFNAN